MRFHAQERGAAFDAARYSWHIATLFLGAVFAPACTPHILGSEAVHVDDGWEDGGRAHRGVLNVLGLEIATATPSAVSSACVRITQM